LRTSAKRVDLMKLETPQRRLGKKGAGGKTPGRDQGEEPCDGAEITTALKLLEEVPMLAGKRGRRKEMRDRP